MGNLRLKVAFWDYDRTRALADGTVKIDGVDATFHSARIVSEMFEGMIRQREFDVSELGMTYYLRTLDFDDPPFIALPVFPNRSFRHSAIYVNVASGIKKRRIRRQESRRICDLWSRRRGLAEGYPVRRVWCDTGPVPLDRWPPGLAHGANRFHPSSPSCQCRGEIGPRVQRFRGYVGSGRD